MGTIIGNTINIREDEKYIVNTLKNYLPDDYEIFFKPFLNGEEPDIIILKRYGGIYLINISKLDVRSIVSINVKNNKQYMVIKDIKFEVKTPIDRIKEQKFNLYNYHIEALLEEKIKNTKALGIVGTGIIFSKNISKNVNMFFKKEESYVDIYGIDEIKNLINNTRKRFNYNGRFFSDKVYFEFVKKLSFNNKIDNEEIYYLSKKQQELVKSKPGKTKIKGIAGAGKTIVLANRVVNHIKRLKEQGRESKVLILTFNITLRNYIMDNIMKICDFEVSNKIRISHYHKFIMDSANKYSIANVNTNDERLFEDIYWIEKYDGIFIDEIQDYKIQWQNLLVNSFLKENGEYVVFGDEKQNIYDRELEGDKCVKTNIKGNWNKLEKSFRIQGLLVELAISFQRKFLRRYELDEYVVSDRNFFGLEQQVKYIQCTPEDLDEVAHKCIELLENKYIDLNKAVIISATVELLRVVDEKIRNANLNVKHVITFETEKEYKVIEERCLPNNQINSYGMSRLNKEIEAIRRNRKYNFASENGLKISTIHSFKGWQEETVVLIINDSNRNSDELIYTGITRCKTNLFILDCSFERRYKDFFEDFEEGDKYESI